MTKPPPDKLERVRPRCLSETSRSHCFVLRACWFLETVVNVAPSQNNANGSSWTTRVTGVQLGRPPATYTTGLHANTALSPFRSRTALRDSIERGRGTMSTITCAHKKGPQSLAGNGILCVTVTKPKGSLARPPNPAKRSPVPGSQPMVARG